MKYLPLLAMTVGVVVMGAGCNPFQSAQDRAQQAIGERIAEQIVERGSGGKVDLDTSGGALNVRDNESGNTVSLSTTGEATIPANFPAAIGKYSGAKTVAATLTPDGKTGSLMQQTTDTQDRVVTWATASYQGWRQASTMDLGESGRMFVFVKDQIRAGVTISASQDQTQPGTTIVTTFGPETAQ